MRTEDPVGGMADATVSLTGRGEFTPGGVDSVSRNGSGLVTSVYACQRGRGVMSICIRRTAYKQGTAVKVGFDE